MQYARTHQLKTTFNKFVAEAHQKVDSKFKTETRDGNIFRSITFFISSLPSTRYSSLQNKVNIFERFYATDRLFQFQQRDHNLKIVENEIPYLDY